KELADAQAADELLLEIDQALEPKPAAAPNREEHVQLTDWADGPGSIPANDLADSGVEPDGRAAAAGGGDLPLPTFGLEPGALPDEPVGDEEDSIDATAPGETEFALDEAEESFDGGNFGEDESAEEENDDEDGDGDESGRGSSYG